VVLVVGCVLAFPLAARALDPGATSAATSAAWSFLGGMAGSWASKWSLLKRHTKECPARNPIRDE
jgi:hypothetical protein